MTRIQRSIEIKRPAVVPCVGGMGLVAVDHVFVAEHGGPYIYHATRGGGSVWNALARLTALGHPTKAFGTCAKDQQGIEALHELAFLGIDTTAMSIAEDGITPVFTQWLNETNRDGPATPQDNFTLACPVCEHLPDLSSFVQFAPPALDIVEADGSLRVACFDRLTDCTVDAKRSAVRAGAFAAIDLGGLSGLISRNKSELVTQLREFELVSMPGAVASWLTADRPEDLAAMLFSGRTGILALTNGRDGFNLFVRSPAHSIQSTNSPAPLAAHVVDACGAGDAFMAALISCALELGASDGKPPFLALPLDAIDGMVRVLRAAPCDVLRGIGAR